MRLIDPSRDVATLEKALPVFIARAASRAESDMQRRRAELRRAVALNPERLDRLEAGPAIPYAVELWIGHLAFLDLLAGVVALGPADLTAEEARGLAMFRAQREKFWSDHTRCPQCNAVNRRGAAICAGGCGRKLGGPDAG